MQAEFNSDTIVIMLIGRTDVYVVGVIYLLLVELGYHYLIMEKMLF